MPVQLN